MNPLPMQHLDDEQLTDSYYGEFDASAHLAACGDCRDRFHRLRETLDSFNQFPIPHRDAEHAARVWTSLLSKLPPDKPRQPWLRWWVLTPSIAALLTIAFVTGRLTERSHPAGIPEKARERVLLLSLSDHLEQSQIVLSNVANAGPGSPDLTYERDRAHELLGANRLLRQTARRLGDFADAALLDELERVLLNFANAPERLSPVDLERTQQQIDQQGLLFKVRITSASSRERGERL
jgi:hypothetical protein